MNRKTARVELGNSVGRMERRRGRELEGEPESTVAWMPRENEVPGRSGDRVSITEPSREKDCWF